MAFEYDLKVIVESAIVGREIECAVLVMKIQRLVLVVKCINDAFYAYNTKYIDEDGAKVVPAVMDENLVCIFLSCLKSIPCS